MLIIEFANPTCLLSRRQNNQFLDRSRCVVLHLLDDATTPGRQGVLESVDGVYRPHQVFAVAERPSLESPEDRGVQHPSALCSEHELMFWHNDLDWPRTLCSLHADLMYRHNIFWPPAPYLQHHSLWRSVEVNSKQTPAPLCSGWMLSSGQGLVIRSNFDTSHKVTAAALHKIGF